MTSKTGDTDLPTTPTRMLWLMRQVWFLPPIAALCLAFAHPPVGFGPLIFLGFAALIGFLADRSTPMKGFWWGFAIGLVAMGIDLFFLSQMVGEPGTEWLTRGLWVYSTIICALPGAIFSCLFVWCSKRLRPMWMLPIAPLLWCGTEWFRYTLSGGCPLLMPGYSLAEIPILLQIADIGSVHLVDFFIVFVGASLAFAIRFYALGNKRLYRICSFIMVLSFVPVLLYGAIRVHELSQDIRPDGPKVALIQPNIAQDLKRKESALNSAQARWDAHQELSLSAVTLHPDLDLIVWSETAVPYSFPRDWAKRMGPEDDASRTGTRYDFEPKSLARDRLRTNLIVGVTMSPSDEELDASYSYLTPTERDRARYNTAVWLDGEGRPRGHHNKVWLVPGGEFLPARDTWLGEFAKSYASELLTNFAPSSIPGKAHETFAFDGKDGREYQFSMSICYEFAFPQLYRELHWDSAKDESRNVYFNTLLSNEAWYQGGAELDQAVALSQMRAIENRCSMLRACNDGITCIVDPLGRISHKLEVDGKDRQVKGTLIANVPVRNTLEATVFQRIGLWPWEWLSNVTLLFTGLLVLSQPIRRIVRKRSKPETPDQPEVA